MVSAKVESGKGRERKSTSIQSRREALRLRTCLWTEPARAQFPPVRVTVAEPPCRHTVEMKAKDIREAPSRGLEGTLIAVTVGAEAAGWTAGPPPWPLPLPIPLRDRRAVAGHLE